MSKYILLLFSLFVFSFLHAQTDNVVNNPEAGTLLQKVSDKYKSYQNISASFSLSIVRPKINPNDDERKLTDTVNGKVILQQAKFNLTIKDQQLICDGKTLWTYVAEDKEVQINYFEETDDLFSPSKIFMLYREGFMYQIKEKKTVGGKKLTVIEMIPQKKNASYFKIDVTVDETSLQVVETRIYEKNGVRYIYHLIKQTPNVPVQEDTFVFDSKKYSGVKVVDLR